MPEAAAYFWGIEVSDWLSAVLNFLGIVAAILTSLWLSPKIADRQGVRSNQERILRMLLGTRLTPANADYQTAIALIPLEFKGVPAVITAVNTYISTVNVPVDLSDPALLAAHHKLVDEQQHQLIVSIATVLGFPDITAEMLDQSRYISMGFMTKEVGLQSALASWPRIADALEKSNAINAEFAARAIVAAK